MAKKLPVYSICSIQGKEKGTEEFMVARFGEYLAQRGYLLQPHGHSFYHLVLFTKGGGEQGIDFASFPVKPGQIYFMTPGQVHNWNFTGTIDGYIINFSESFFNHIADAGTYLETFRFFSGHGAEQVVQLANKQLNILISLFENILEEASTSRENASDMIKSLLLQLFITVNRQTTTKAIPQQSKSGFTSIRNFQQLVNTHYTKFKLPSEYAALLYVTPNYLNSLCKDLLGKSAGEIIRDRIMLEAKRLLINVDMSISEIANRLQFHDNSYFTKFFKKYAGKTPEEFRNDYHITSTK